MLWQTKFVKLKRHNWSNMRFITFLMCALLNCLYISNSVSLTEKSEIHSRTDRGRRPQSIGTPTNEATEPSRAHWSDQPIKKQPNRPRKCANSMRPTWLLHWLALPASHFVLGEYVVRGGQPHPDVQTGPWLSRQTHYGTYVQLHHTEKNLNNRIQKQSCENRLNSTSKR